MHREINNRNRLLSYIKGNRKGREAHDLEREAMLDPFMADALDGYDTVIDPDFYKRIRHMEAKIKQHGLRDYIGLLKKYRKNYVFWISAASILLFVGILSFRFGVSTGMNRAECVVHDNMFVQASCLEYDSVLEPESEQIMKSVQKEAKQNDRMESIHEPIKREINIGPCPKVGYKSYYDYVYGKMALFKALNDSEIKGIVVLSFQVGRDGVPFDFHIVECTSADIAQRLIDIIKTGPRWNNPGHIPSFVIVY